MFSIDVYMWARYLYVIPSDVFNEFIIKSGTIVLLCVYLITEI